MSLAFSLRRWNYCFGFGFGLFWYRNRRRKTTALEEKRKKVKMESFPFVNSRQILTPDYLKLRYVQKPKTKRIHKGMTGCGTRWFWCYSVMVYWYQQRKKSQVIYKAKYIHYIQFLYQKGFSTTINLLNIYCIKTRQGTSLNIYIL